MGFTIDSNGTFICGLFSIENDEVLITKKIEHKKIDTRNIKSQIIKRIKVLNNFLEELIQTFSIKSMIIERQYKNNEIAHGLSCSIVSHGLLRGLNVEMFTPHDKFRKLGLKYDTKNKQHKTLSIQIFQEFLEENNKNLWAMINELNISKLDDIADSFLQLMVVSHLRAFQLFILGSRF